MISLHNTGAIQGTGHAGAGARFARTARGRAALVGLYPTARTTIVTAATDLLSQNPREGWVSEFEIPDETLYHTGIPLTRFTLVRTLQASLPLSLSRREPLALGHRTLPHPRTKGRPPGDARSANQPRRAARGRTAPGKNVLHDEHGAASVDLGRLGALRPRSRCGS